MEAGIAPLVSAVICTRNRADKIGQAIESVLANTYSNFDVTVVDQSTNSETEKIVRSLAQGNSRVRYNRMSQAGLSRAYNLAINCTTGTHIAFTDDDCIVPTDWMQKIVHAFQEQPDSELLYGQVLPLHPDSVEIGWTPSLTFDKPERLDQINGFRIFCMGANFAARRSLFDRVGLFDEALGGGGPLKSSQDFDLAYRAYRRGAAILLRPEVTLLHDGQRTTADGPALLFAYGFGDGAFYSKHARCLDLYATWLTTKVLAKAGVKSAVRSVLSYKTDNNAYFWGFIKGAREGMRFDVDRSTLLYKLPVTG